jgi:hypothetical protein
MKSLLFVIALGGLQGSEEGQQGLPLGRGQAAERIARRLGLAAMPEDGFRQAAGAPVMQVEGGSAWAWELGLLEALPETAMAVRIDIWSWI